MPRANRRHTNQDFAQSVSLMIADVFIMGILGYIFLGITFEEDKGVIVRLPPYYQETEDTIKIPSSAILHLDLNDNSRLLINSIPVSYDYAFNAAYLHISPRIPRQQRHCIWLRTSRSARYREYVRLRDLVEKVRKAHLDFLSNYYYGEEYMDDMPFTRRKRLLGELDFCLIEEDELGWPAFER